MFTTQEFAEGPARRGPHAPRRWLLAAAAAVLIVIVSIVAIALIRDRTTDSATSTEPGTLATATPPRELEWKLINGVRLPFGADGPAKVEGPRAHGYTHTPHGALLAAWQISTRVLTDVRYEQILSTQVRADLGQQQQLRNAVTQTRNLSPEEFDAAFRQPVAFQFATYTPTFARIYFAVPSSKGGYDFQRRAVLWDGNDWVYQVDSGLPELPNSTALKGFTTF
ncbi:hypothetical protein DFR70_12612 [Nocardia tenerifensis]|uniref:DUF8175 domain-containing protein n=1 Tax=Nocardia tenerifensis TaxID=228006 RepID=A0A318K118_9NOCA|nr:hypothetical protein [Nocardia tenerifensis]PXX53891.1 hypothetical protein DFR70_12612 [Nocardia tenerifensis]